MSIRSTRSFIASLATVAIVASATLAFAQAPMPTQPGIAPGQTPISPSDVPAVPGQQQTLPGQQQAVRTEPAPASRLSGDLAQLLIGSNRNEVDMSRFGQDRAQSQPVREFAKNMVVEHQDFVHKLEKAAAASGVGGPTPAAPGVSPPAGTVIGQPGAASELVQVLQQIGDRQVAIIQRDLSNRQGIEFDQAFIGHELAAHFAMLAALQTAANHVTGQLQQVVNEGIQTTQRHIDHAQTIMQQLEQTQLQQAGKPAETQKR